VSATPAEPSRRLLRHPDFLKLWTGQTISGFGSQITILAVPVVAALTLKVSPFQFGLIATIEFLPYMLMSLPAGVWVDRLRRRPILIVADLGRAISLLSIPLAFAFGALTLWQLYVVVLVNGCLTVFFDVAYQSYLPSIVERDQLVEGNGKLETTRTISQRLGPGLAGILVTLLSAPFAVVFDAVSFLISAGFVAWIRRPEPSAPVHDEKTGRRRSMRAEIVTGLRYVARQRLLRAMAATVAIEIFFGNVADSILILYLVTERGFTPALIGLAFSIGSVGVIVAALLTSRTTKVLGVGPLLILSAVGSSMSWLLVAAAPDSLLFVGLVGTILALGFFGVAWNINALSLRQAVTPGPMLGKANASMRFISWSVIPFGTMAGGFLGGVIGLHNTIWVGAIGCVVAFLPVALSPLRQVRDMPAPAAAMADL
jgi:MFS family permease